MNETQFFDAVVQLSPAERAAYLNQACAGDPALRARVEVLLLVHDQAGHLLDKPFPTVSEQTGSYVSAEPDTLAKAGTLIAGRYKLLQQIGQGGMGSIWMADQIEPVKRRVAVKLIRTERGNFGNLLTRFEVERQAIALMDHPHIAKLLDAGAEEAGGWRPEAGDQDSILQPPASSLQPFFVMELVKGMPLNQYCDEHKLSIPERLQLFMQICSAVQHAHQKGIIHRDLKPSNILVESHDGKPVPKVIDFGLAKALSGQPLTENTLFTAFGVVAGTPLYMAPEQTGFNALDVDTRADIYALGVILYELLTGSTPIENELLKKAGFEEVLRVLRESEPPTPSKRLSSTESKPSIAANRQTEPVKLSRLLRGDLDWIVMKALAKERDHRYETALDFAKDIERFLNHEPVSAGPPSLVYKLRKFARRHRVALLAGTTVAAALILGTVVSIWQMVLARRAEAVAVTERDEKEKAWKEEAAQHQRAEENAKQAKKQEAEARRQQQRAEDEYAIAEAFWEFFRDDVLRQASPRQQAQMGFTPEPNLTLKEALNRAAAQIGNRFQSRPQVEAGFRQAIASAYMDLGDYRQAHPHLERALVLREELGPDHVYTISAQASLARNYVLLGRPAEAVPLYEKTLALEKTRRAPPPREEEMLGIMNGLAIAYNAAGRRDDGFAVYKEALARRKAVSGPDHPATLVLMSNLSQSYLRVGWVEEAIALQEETLRLRKAALGAEHPMTLSSMNALALAYTHAGRPAEAITLHTEALKRQKARLGPEHPETILTLQNLAWTHAAVGRVGEALPLLEQVVRVRTAKLGANHPNTRVAQMQFEIARTLKPVTAPYAFQLTEAATLREVGTLDRAELIGLAVVQGRRRLLGADHPDTAAALSELGLTRLLLHKYAEAEPVLRDALALRLKKEPDAWTTFHTQSCLGGALLGQKKYPDAEPFLLQGYAGLKQRADKIPLQGKVRLTEALERLVQLYEAMDKKDEAAKWRKELEIAKKANAPSQKEK